MPGAIFGCVANTEKGEERRMASRISGGDRLKLFLERGCRVEGEAALALAHHVNHLDAGQCNGSRGE